MLLKYLLTNERGDEELYERREEVKRGIDTLFLSSTELKHKQIKKGGKK